MNDPRLQERLVRRLNAPLPGAAAQRLYEPDLSYGRHYAPPPPTARQAAVVALLYPHKDAWHLPLMLRPDTMADHAGQVSFPGGMIEPGEQSAEAALREMEEELGIATAAVELLGQLTPLYLFVTDFYVTPWLAIASSRPEIRPNPIEVAEVLEVPATVLLDPAHSGEHEHQHRGLKFRAPHFHWQQHRIWGATGMMLGEVAAVLREATELPLDDERETEV